MVRMEGIGIELKGLTPYRRCRRPFLRHVMLPSSAHLFAVPRRCRERPRPPTRAKVTNVVEQQRDGGEVDLKCAINPSIRPSVHLDTHIDRPMDGNRHKSSTHELPTMQCIHSQHFWIRFADRLEKKQAFSIHSAGVADVRRARARVVYFVLHVNLISKQVLMLRH